MKRYVNKNLILNSRITNNLTVQKFCKKCHISKNTYYKIINTERCGFVPLLRIATIMQIDLKEMFPQSE